VATDTLIEEAITQLLELRTARDLAVQAARGELVNSLAFGEAPKDVQAAMDAWTTAQARADVVDTAVSYVHAGDVSSLGAYLRAAWLTGPVADATHVEATRRAGYRTEIAALTGLVRRLGQD
jgi:hypothetical protein